MFRRRTPAAEPAGPPPAAGLAELLAEVRRIQVQSSRLVTDVLAGGYCSTFRGAGIEVAEVREYAEGDDPRTIDWNVTARAGRPFVKRYVEERERTVLFLLDLSASMDHGLGAWTPRQLAARFCALLGLAAIANKDRVGLCAGSAGVERFVPPKAGPGHVLRVVRDCLLLRGAAPATDLGALVDHACRRLRRRAVVFLLSDFLVPARVRSFATGSRRHDLVAVRLWPRELLDPPPLLARVADPETGGHRLVDFAAPAVRAAWLQRAAALRAAVDEELGRAGIDTIAIDAPAHPDLAAIAGPLRQFFHRRERRAAHR